jgi:lipoate-protein ligase A
VAVGLATLEVDSRRLRATYELLTAPIARALRACGADASLAERTVHVSPRQASRIDCFATTAPLDLVGADGAKVGGIALRLTENAVLLQSSIPRAGWDWEEFPAAVQASFAEFTARLEPATMKGL